MSSIRLSRARVRAGRAVGYIWFVVVAMPVFFFAAGMAVDVSHEIVVHREVVLAAQAAADAGAWQIGTDGSLDTQKAYDAANNLLSEEQNSQYNSVPGASVSNSQITVDNNVVTVSVTYTLNDLIFTPFFGIDGNNAFTVTTSSFVCDSTDTSGPTGGACVRPLA